VRFLFISIYFICTNLISNELIFTCENNFAYRLIDTKNNQQSFYKTDKSNWIEIKDFNIINNKLELFIPGMTYLGCADKNLPVCKYSILIKDFKLTRPIVTEVVLNDCYIGTMGCNEYKKGLELNQSFCKSN
tara:strand:- start:95 stop:490 length:396 start_codon:yes stop_codon:yes gene_type:complete